MRVHDSTLCFVNSREIDPGCKASRVLTASDLAAFASALDRRRSDYSALLKSLTFSRPAGEGILPAYEEFLPENRDKLLSVEDSHVLVSASPRPLYSKLIAMEVLARRPQL